ncbi:hypothetical protein F5Y08DRAFT_308003 [Xylaria arbuscula]|nr:hypothetical protein F5Y08DRAFT_308003 [Xylaria arbuscula]
MQQRRPHKKSRRGCLNCKKWHTKCDESGPPCNNCTLRNAECEYAWQKGLVQARSSPSSQTSDESGLGEPGRLLAHHERRRLLELELMHLWSTTTYKGLCSVPEDQHYMQMVLPQEALRYDFLLNGIFVAAALQRSTMVPEPEARGYFNVAMELYDRASKSFRIHLAKMDPTSHHVLYIYSSMTAFINIAFSQCNYTEGSELNTLSTVAVAFDLLNGSVNIAKSDFQGLLDSPVPLRAYLNYGLASTVALHPSTRAALDRLSYLSELYHSSHQQRLTPIPNIPSDEQSVGTSDTLSPASPAIPATPWKVAIGLLQHCFAEEQRAILRGFCFVFPGGAGPDFAAAVKASDPMALLVLMHWAVLIERAGNDFWWAKNLGRRLAIGSWKAMQLFRASTSFSPAILTPQWEESISWVCRQLGLPEFVSA